MVVIDLEQIALRREITMVAVSAFLEEVEEEEDEVKGKLLLASRVDRSGFCCDIIIVYDGLI